MNYSGREWLLFVVFIWVAGEGIERLPENLWWLTGILAVASGQAFARFIVRRPEPSHRVWPVGVVVAVLVSLAVRFLR